MVNLQSSWALAKSSWAVLKSDRELLLFPFFAFLGFVAVVILFLIPTVPLVLNGGLVSTDAKSLNPIAYVLYFLFYVVAYTVVFFFNTGLVGAAMIRLNGGNPTVRDGFRIALSHLPAIVGWAVIAATVGMVLRALSSGKHPIARGLSLILGVTWSVLTFLVVPIIIAENVGPIGAIRRSRALISKTWGQSLIGGASISAVFGIGAVLIAFIGFWLAVNVLAGSTALQAAVVGVSLLASGAVGLLGAALSGIYHASLYRYATTGSSGEGAAAEAAMSNSFESRFQVVDSVFQGSAASMPKPGIHIGFGRTPTHNLGFRAPTPQSAGPAPVIDAAPPVIDAAPPVAPTVDAPPVDVRAADAPGSELGQ